MKRTSLFLGALLTAFAVAAAEDVVVPGAEWNLKNGIESVKRAGDTVSGVIIPNRLNSAVGAELKKSIDAKEYDGAVFSLKLDPGAAENCKLVFASEADPQVRVSFPFKAGTSGDYNLYPLEMGRNPRWKGKFKRVYLEFGGTKAPVAFAVKEMTLRPKLTMTPREASRPVQLREWRLQASGVKAQMSDEFEKRKFAVKVDYAGGKPGRLALSCHAVHCPLDSWIPPFIGSDARQFKVLVYPVVKSGNASAFVELRVRGKDARSHTWLKKKIDFSRKGWQEIAIDVKASPLNRLADVNFAVYGNKASSCSFWFADARIIRADGSEYEVLNAEEPKHTEGFNSGSPTAPHKALPKRPQIAIGLGTYNFLYGREFLKEIGKMAKEEFPGWDFVLSVGQAPEPESANILRELPENVYAQFQIARHDLRYLALFDHLTRNQFGEPQKARNNGMVPTSPILQRGFKDMFDYAAKIGFNNFAIIDYVWLGMGGLWGYDPATVAAFRDDLSGRDEGLELQPGPGEKRTKIHFWDYFEDSHALRFTPAELGIKSYDEYFPITEREMPKRGVTGQRNYSVFLALCSYEWLRQAQRFNRVAAEHKGNFDYILNGENWANGNDHYYLLKLKGTGIVSPEYFSSVPQKNESYYRTVGIYLRQAARSGTRYGAILETSRGGNGQPYWSPKTGYSVAYALSAMGLQDMHYDHIHVEKWKASNTPGETQERANYALFRAEAQAFIQAKHEKSAKEPAMDILDVFPRGTVFRAWAYNTPGDKSAWAPWLNRAQVNYERTDFIELPLLLNSARVVFWSSPFTPQKSADAVEKWLATGGKTLVIHSDLPWRAPNGYANLHRMLEQVKPDYSKPVFRDFVQKNPGKCVLKDARGKALVNRIDRKDGSRIYHIAGNPEKLPAGEIDRIFAYLTKELRLPVVQKALPGPLPTVLRFRNPDCQVAVLWNKQEADAAEAKIGDWYRNKWATFDTRNNGQIRTMSKFRYDNYLYHFQLPGKRTQALLDDVKPGTYRVYRFLADREDVVPVSAEGLKLELADELTDVFYFAPDTEQFRKYIAELRVRRKKLEPFFAEIK